MRHNTNVLKNLRRLRAGVVAAEFAITCPLLLLLCMACADFGRIGQAYQVIGNAARVGGELGAAKQFTDYTRVAWEDEIYAAVLAEMQNLNGFSESKLTYELTTTTDANGLAHVLVEVKYPFKTMITWPLIPAETELTKKIEFYQFR